MQDELHATIIDDAVAWDVAILQLPHPHVLQSQAWGDTKAQTGWRARRLLWERGGRPVAGAAMLVRRLGNLPAVPGVPAAVAYVPKGPLLDWTDLELADAVLGRLEGEARRSGAIFLKVDPDVRADAPQGQAVRSLLARRGWRPSAEQIQFRNTVINDLTKDEAALLAAMKPKWRYNIRLAERRGVAVRAGSAADLPAFYEMYVETGRRDGFLVRPYPYYRAIWERFLATGLAHLLLAEAGPGAVGEALDASGASAGSAGLAANPVAGLILFRFGPTAWYFYGASTARARQLMPNHALQWAALRWAKGAGCTRYDWWGAPDTLDESDPMWGVYRFKEGFGGEFVPGIGAYDYSVNRPLYWLYSVAMPRLLDIARSRHRVAVPAGASPEDTEI